MVRLLAALNPAAAIVQASFAKVPLAALLAPPPVAGPLRTQPQSNNRLATPSASADRREAEPSPASAKRARTDAAPLSPEPVPQPDAGAGAGEERSPVEAGDVRAVEAERAQAGAMLACTECAEEENASARARRTLPRRLRLAVTNFSYVRDRPFHPVRLAERVIARMPTRRPRGQTFAAAQAAAAAGEEAEAGEGAEAEANPLAQLLRSKGFVWLASQPRSSFRWAYAGCHFLLAEYCEMAAAGSDAAPPAGREGQLHVGSEGGAGGSSGTVASASCAAGPGSAPSNGAGSAGSAGGVGVAGVTGARLGQRLVFIGLSLPEEQIVQLLDSCLLEDWEMAYFEKGLVPPETQPTEAANSTSGSIVEGLRAEGQGQEEPPDAERASSSPEAGQTSRPVGCSGGACQPVAAR